MRIYQIAKKDKVSSKWTYDTFSDETIARAAYRLCADSREFRKVDLNLLEDTNGMFEVSETLESFDKMTRRKFYIVWTDRGGYASIESYKVCKTYDEAKAYHKAWYEAEGREQALLPKKGIRNRVWVGNVRFCRTMVYEDLLPRVASSFTRTGVSKEEFIQSALKVYE